MRSAGNGANSDRREQALGATGLDVCYERASGSAMFHDGDRRVWDFLGGYGSTLFGHNHPELVAALREFLAREGVVHAQASAQGEARVLRDRLRVRLEAALGRDFHVLLASTGSEAVEVAARHAAAALSIRTGTLMRSLRPAPAASWERWSPEAEHRMRRLGLDPSSGWEAVRTYNEDLVGRPTVHLAMEGAYHGMTTGALALTRDAGSAFGVRPRGLQVRFVDPLDAGAVEAAVRATRVTLLRVGVSSAGWTLEPVPWSPVASLFVEPLQGEGGIFPLSSAVAEAWREACDRHGIPLVADEIQSGMGRTGTFLFCEQIGLRPDYLLLGKSLGGGLTKVSAVCLDVDQVVPEFTLQYVSTFAEDGASSAVASRALEVLARENGADQARRKGERILRGLRDLARRHPEVIAQVRGAGLMLGVEFRRDVFDRANLLDFLQGEGWLGYAVAGFLLRRHGIRVAPTLSRGHTIRIEPAYGVPDEAVADLFEALDDLCGVLARQDSAALMAACLNLVPPPPLNRLLPVRTVRAPEPGGHVGFVGHFIEPADIARWDPSLARLEDGGAERVLDTVFPFVEPVLVRRDHLTSSTGRRVTLSFYGLAVPSWRFHAALRNRDVLGLRDLIRRSVARAAADGCSVVGLGGYSSIITRNGRDVADLGVAVTTGNGLTAGVGLQAMRETALEHGLGWSGGTVAVVGATGNLGTVLSELLADEVSQLVLVGRPLRRAALDALAARLRDMSGCRIDVATALDGCRSASVIVGVSNHPAAVLYPEHLGEGPIVVNDLAVPSDVSPEVEALERVRVIRGGVVRAVRQPGWEVPGIPLGRGELYACMAETVLMGLDDARTHGSLGSLTAGRVREVLCMAERHGFRSVRSRTSRSY